MSAEATDLESQTWRPSKPLMVFFGGCALLFVLRLILGFIAVPPQVAIVLSVLTTAIFILVPVIALFAGASADWKPSNAWILMLVGAILHGGNFLLMRQVKLDAISNLLSQNLMQFGMLCWTLALGVLVAILIREKNMLLPIAIFLAGMDALLILAPMTPQAQIIAQNPEIVGNIGLRIPSVKSTTPENPNVPVGVNDLGYVGPADLFISAMFFAALFRYKMRAKETATWLGPVLLGYLFIVLATSMPLPALVPIGITVLIINWREFQMKKEEKQATWLVAFIALAMAGFGLYARINYKPPELPPESSQMDPSQGSPKPGDLPPQAPPDQNR